MGDDVDVDVDDDFGFEFWNDDLYFKSLIFLHPNYNHLFLLLFIIVIL